MLCENYGFGKIETTKCPDLENEGNGSLTWALGLL